MKKSLYDILQVLPEASQEVIRAAYKSLAAKYHPDKDSSKEAAEQFARVQQAFETLSDPDKRTRYDVEREANAGTRPTFGNTIMRVDGTSSHLTLDEHLKRGGRELADCDLTGLTLDGASFRGANLERAKLDGSSLIGCDFRQANLTDCSAKNCKFPGVFFGGARILRTDFTESNLRGAAFFGAGELWKSTLKDQQYRFEYSDLQKSIHDETVCTGPTRIELSIFTRCDLTASQFAAPTPMDSVSETSQKLVGLFERQVPVYFRQRFTPSVLINSHFSNANMQQCDLKGISLSGSNFDGAVLNGAQMQGCNIEAVDLSTCSVTNVDLHNTKYSIYTVLPSGFRLPENAKKVDPTVLPSGYRPLSAAIQTPHVASNTSCLAVVMTVAFLMIMVVVVLFAAVSVFATQ